MTALQSRIVCELNLEDLNDIGIMHKLHLSQAKYYAEKRVALRKIQDAIANKK